MEQCKNTLKIKNLCVQVDGKELLHNLNLTIPVGEVHALLGLNGSGKTSLMMAIMGFPKYQVTKGQILFKEKDIMNLDITERARLGIGIAQQRPPTINGVKLRHILDYAFMNEPRYIHEMPAMIKTADMEKFLDRDINDGLSGGEIKRAELLQLLATQPRFSMMDEPDSGTDLESIEIIGELLNLLFSRDACHPAKRRAGLIVTHSGNIFDYVDVDKAHIMLNGQIGCSGNPHIIFNTIKKYGYEECIHCMKEGVL